MSLLYLTEKEKFGHLKFLAQQIKAKHVDPKIIPWLKKINKINGVCTTQSCAGHKRGKYQDDEHIRFRLSKPMMNIFLKMLPILYMDRKMYYVDVRYHSVRRVWDWVSRVDDTDFCPEIMIDFLGLNRSSKHLEDFLSHLLDILQQCSTYCRFGKDSRNEI